ncbi:glycogen debranching N-terminal domain-containing protein [Bifidobacterium samirii]|nr:glycogen debranching N-terminal domain-containing protein [Bifidobacterium samirii]
MSTNTQPRQPWMHDMKPLVCAPTQLWADPDGVVDATAPHAGTASIAGLYHGDTRIVSAIRTTVDGEAPVPVAWRAHGKGASTTTMIVRNIDGPTVDPQVRVEERRDLTPDALAERCTVTSALDHDVTIRLAVTLRFDMATMQEVKGGAPSAVALDGRIAVDVADTTADGVRTVRVTDGKLAAVVTADATAGTPPCVAVDGTDCTLIWTLAVPARGTAAAGLTVAVDAPGNVVRAATAACPWADVHVHAADSRVADWINTSLRDLDGLRMAIPALPDDEFLAAGAPWFFTLFGRDSLWAARFLLPLTTRTAMGTLRTLAHFQATASDPATNADPGKIMHELRAEQLVQTGAFDDGTSLPPLYYGTIDATPLWIVLLAEAARWGAPDDEIRALIPNLEAALAWLRDWGDCDGDGFLEYIDRTGRGLSNQGWKDSGDSVRWNDGTIARGPIALCEVQGYAYQAAMLGADLLDRYGRPGADGWRAWAARLKERFNEAFWVDDGRGRYPAIALDADKRPVDSLTSNIGHLLGTGILDEDGVRDVVARLTGDDMLSGYGVRTMSTLAGGYSPLSYHCGSVWAHDSAVVMNGLRDEGYEAEALRVAEGLVRAAASFGYQIPELYAGDAFGADGFGSGPAPYPAACHPQAWSAASSVAVLSLLLGLAPDGEASDGASAAVDSPLARDLRIEGR